MNVDGIDYMLLMLHQHSVHELNGDNCSCMNTKVRACWEHAAGVVAVSDVQLKYILIICCMGNMPSDSISTR